MDDFFDKRCLETKTSRFNKDYPLKEHMQFVVDNLKEAGESTIGG